MNNLSIHSSADSHSGLYEPQRLPYLRPDLELIQMETEGVIAGSGSATGNGDDIYFQSAPRYNAADEKAINEFLEDW